MVLFELPVGNNKHPTSNGGDGGGVWIVLFFDVTPVEVSVSLSTYASLLWVAVAFRVTLSEKVFRVGYVTEMLWPRMPGKKPYRDLASENTGVSTNFVDMDRRYSVRELFLSNFLLSTCACMCWGSMLSLVEILFSFVCGCSNEFETSENILH